MCGSHKAFANMKICTGLLLISACVLNVSLSLAQICVATWHLLCRLLTEFVFYFSSSFCAFYLSLPTSSEEKQEIIL